MGAVQTFLAELDARIQAVSARENRLGNARNTLLELENIFYENAVMKDSMTIYDLIKLPELDLERIVEIIGLPNIESCKGTLRALIQIINLYEGLVPKYGDIPEASQYLVAKEELEQLLALIKIYLENNQELHLKESSPEAHNMTIYKKYQAMFRAGELVTPIFNMNEFNQLLNTMRLTTRVKAELKKAIGQANIKLVVKPKAPKAPELLEKYYLVLAKKEAVYADALKVIPELLDKLNLHLRIESAEEQIVKLTETRIEAYKNIQNAVVCILLKEVLTNVAEKSVEDVVANCEKLLRISRKHAPKVLTKPVVAEASSLPNKEAETLITHVKNVIENERSFLESINPDDYGRYAQLLTIMDKKAATNQDISNKYRLAMVIESLKQELKAFEITAEKYRELPMVFNNTYKQQIGTIKEYITAYELLKTRLKNS